MDHSGTSATGQAPHPYQISASDDSEYDIPAQIDDHELLPYGSIPEGESSNTIPYPTNLIEDCTKGKVLEDGKEPDISEERALFSSIGGVKRRLEGFQPWVHVQNDSSKTITVLVSAYRPRRLLTGGGVVANATGGGLNFAGSLYSEHTRTKRLSAGAVHGVDVGFHNRYVFIDVFVDGEDTARPCETGKVPLGGLARFDGTEFRIFDRKGFEVVVPKPPHSNTANEQQPG